MTLDDLTCEVHIADHTRTGRRHLGRYADPMAIFDRYRVCLDCGRVIRNDNLRPLLHNGRKPR